MRNLFTKYPVISWMSVGYVLYSLLPFIGMSIGDSLGEYGEIFRFSMFLWPYPLILSLQSWIDITSNTLLLFYPLGLGLVIIYGHYFILIACLRYATGNPHRSKLKASRQFKCPVAPNGWYGSTAAVRDLRSGGPLSGVERTKSAGKQTSALECLQSGAKRTYRRHGLGVRC